jgi:hypothetical protein
MKPHLKSKLKTKRQIVWLKRHNKALSSIANTAKEERKKTRMGL